MACCEVHPQGTSDIPTPPRGSQSNTDNSLHMRHKTPVPSQQSHPPTQPHVNEPTHHDPPAKQSVPKKSRSARQSKGHVPLAQPPKENKQGRYLTPHAPSSA